MPDISIIKLDCLRPKAFRCVLEEEEAEWATVMEWDYQASKELLGFLMSTGQLQGVALLAGEKCRGYAFPFTNESRVLLLAYLSPDFRNTRQACSLLDGLFRLPAFVPFPPIIEGQILFPGAGPQGLRGYFKRRGFKVIERNFLRLEQLVPIAAVSLDSALTIQPLCTGELDAMAELLFSSYQNHPDREISILYRSVEGCRKLLIQLLFHSGCGAVEPACSWSARTGDKLIGVILVSIISEQSCFIPQIFVHHDCRGRGVGRALLRAGLESIRKLRPDRHVGLTVTVANDEALAWYRRWGFSSSFPQFAFSRRVGFADDWRWDIGKEPSATP